MIARRDPEKVRAQHRKKMAKRRRERTPEQKARDLVRQAVAMGLLVPEPCRDCGAPAEHSEAHHPSYDEPLEVIWLCRRDHLELHRRLDLQGGQSEDATVTTLPTRTREQIAA